MGFDNKGINLQIKRFIVCDAILYQKLMKRNKIYRQGL